MNYTLTEPQRFFCAIDDADLREIREDDLTYLEMQLPGKGSGRHFEAASNQMPLQGSSRGVIPTWSASLFSERLIKRLTAATP